jgi:hypothetical protein
MSRVERAGDAVALRFKRQAGIVLELNVTRGRDHIGVIYLANRRGDEIDVAVTQLEGETFAADVGAIVDKIMHEAGLNDLERFQLFLIV